MNAQIVKNENKKFSQHNMSNRNGEQLTDFSLENGLTCLKFQKRKGKLWTYTYADNAKAQIDYILMNKKWIYSILNCKAYSSFVDVSSNHRIVTAKIGLNLCRKVTQTAKTTQYNWSFLTNRDISDKYMITLRKNSMLFKMNPKHLL